jgi:hypothetical protein
LAQLIPCFYRIITLCVSDKTFSLVNYNFTSLFELKIESMEKMLAQTRLPLMESGEEQTGLLLDGCACCSPTIAKDALLGAHRTGLMDAERVDIAVDLMFDGSASIPPFSNDVPWPNCL